MRQQLRPSILHRRQLTIRHRPESAKNGWETTDVRASPSTETSCETWRQWSQIRGGPVNCGVGSDHEGNDRSRRRRGGDYGSMRRMLVVTPDDWNLEPNPALSARPPANRANRAPSV